MNGFGNLLDALDTPGGHILILLVMFASGAMMAMHHAPKGEEILIGTFGALLAVLRGAVTNHNRNNGTSQ